MKKLHGNEKVDEKKGRKEDCLLSLNWAVNRIETGRSLKIMNRPLSTI